MNSLVSGTGAARASSRTTLLDAIRGAGRISRADLVRATGLTGATISTVTRRLIDDGLVIEVGRAESTGGKRATLLSLDPESRYTVGVHLDHAGITYVIANLRGAVVGRWRHPGTGSAAPAEVVVRVAAAIDTFVGQVGIDRERLLGLGVVAPGPFAAAEGAAPAEAWADFPLVAELEAAVGLPVQFENDATAAAIGEFWAGDRSTPVTFAALYMGTGIGAGIMVNGDVYRGAGGRAGEVGHICVDLDGPECWCGGRGCVEALAGPAAVVASALDAGLVLPGLGVAEDFAMLAREATVADGVPRELLLRSARYVAAAAQALVTILDLDRLVLTGPGFAHAGSLYVPAIRAQVDRTLFARGRHGLDVVISPEATTAAGLGAAAMVLLSEVAPRPAAVRTPTFEVQPR